MSNRRRCRERAMQILYQMDVGDKPFDKALTTFKQNFEYSEDEESFVSELVGGVAKNLQTINGHIEDHAHNWKMSRIAPIERSLLRLAVYEMLFSNETPAQVVINEAIEVAKRFGNEDTCRFINGVLDSIYRANESLEGEPT